MIRRIGYACINNGLAERNIHVNRGMIKRTFAAKGSSYASELALSNVRDLEEVINWNLSNDILLFRMSSDLFPWMSEYELNELPDFSEIKTVLFGIGKKAKAAGMRLTFHPGQFDVLASTNENVVKKTIKDLRQHAEIMDLIGLPESHEAKINIHVGAAYGDKQAALERFARNFEALPSKVQRRLTVENDDKCNMFSVKDLMWLYERIHIPIVFDYFHHQFCTGGLIEAEAFAIAISTWPSDVVPVVHFSSSRKQFEDSAALDTAHADFIYSAINSYDSLVDVMLEAKAKEIALGRYFKEYESTMASSSQLKNY